MKQDKDYELLLNIYRALYKECDVDFDKLRELNELDFFMHYYVPQEKQTKIVNNCLKGKRITKLKKQAFLNTISLGCSPCSVNFYYKLTRVNDNLVKESDRIRFINFNEQGRFKDWFNTIEVGRSLLISPFNSFFTWQTTLVTEVLENTLSLVRFKTQNSEYKLERIIIK